MRSQSLMRNRGFWLLVAGQSVSTCGDILYTVAVLSFTYTQTESVLGTASILILTTLTRLVAGFFTVQVVDRVPHRQIMIAADLVRGVAVGLLGLASLRWQLGLPAIYAVTVVSAFAGAFFSPARSAILPLIVAKEDLIRANGLVASVVQVLQTVTWALGAVVVAAVGAPLAILANAVSFLLSALATCLIVTKPQEPAVSTRRQGPLERLRSGWDQVWSNRVVRDVTIMDGMETFANTIWTSALMQAFTLEVLKVGAEWWGYQGSAYFVGTVLGGLVATGAAGLLSRQGGWMIAISSASFALLTVWYALCNNPVVAVVLCVAFGPVYQVRDVVQASMLQASMDPRVSGRAFAAREMLLMTLFGPAMALMAYLADVAGPRAAYLLGAGLYGAVAVFAALSVPIRTYRMTASDS